MENAIYIGIARQMALQEQMNATAQNIANVNTTGYRANRVMFETELNHPKGMKPDMSFPVTQKTYRAIGEGAYRQTGNQLDVALQGDGFFTIKGADGGTYYSRAGNFKVNSDNALVTQQGYPVLGQGGSPITIPDGTTHITISETGSIAGDEGTIGQLAIASVGNQRDMVPVGQALYEAAGPVQESSTTKVMQGSLEGSNVQGVLEMTDMIAIMRDYQAVQNMLQSENQRLRDMVGNLTKVQV